MRVRRYDAILGKTDTGRYEEHEYESYLCEFHNATDCDVRVFMSGSGYGLCNSNHFRPWERGCINQSPDPNEVDLRANGRGKDVKLAPVRLPPDNPHFAAHRGIVEIRVFKIAPLTQSENGESTNGQPSASAAPAPTPWFVSPEVWAHPDAVFQFVIADAGLPLHRERHPPSAATMARARTLCSSTLPVCLPPFVALRSPLQPTPRPPQPEPLPVPEIWRPAPFLPAPVPHQLLSHSRAQRHPNRGLRVISDLGARELISGAQARPEVGYAEGRPPQGSAVAGEPTQAHGRAALVARFYETQMRRDAVRSQERMRNHRFRTLGL
ncbi:hypothetical protein EVJ58_g7386 [Rhodofomes roseus]|uniref:Uncharacterized protein n=1 Tax=Rhodofomes roseus TaxID=34475 RepID=A0A4Y9Y4Y6_9APHY|nr:hypothetical protein EVJ58_g7386 [Rhodofomes roseus]